jgi:predicted peroxiredoxin
LSLFSAVSIDTSSVSSQKALDMPAIEFGLFEAYRIKEDGIKEAIIADRGLHYSNKDILHKGFVFAKDEQGIKSIDGDKITLTKDKVKIFGNAHFIDSLGHEIYSEDAIYNLDKNILIGSGKFTVKINDDIVKGVDLLIDAEAKIVRGFEIKATIETDKTNKK